MKTLSSKRLSIYIALITSIVSGILFYISTFINDSDFWKFLIILILAIFITVHIIVNYVINRFIVEKIKPIYKTIHSFNVSENNLHDKIENKDIISSVKDDVNKWAINKTQEIEKLKESAKFRREFIGNISHELKTPIFNIQGYILTLLEGGLEDKEINRKYLMRAEKSTERLINIVNDLEVISQFESGELKLNHEDFNLYKLLDEVIESNELLCKTKNIQISFKTNTEKGMMVNADKQQIYQALNNLLINSIK